MPKSAKRSGLTDKQESFCQHYSTHWNATRAAKDAGYSEKCAKEQGYELLRNAVVRARIKRLTRHTLLELGVSRARVLKELALIAFLDPAAVYRDDGQLLPMSEMPEEARRAVHKVKSFEEFEGRGDDRELSGYIREIEFSPKKGALDTLAKHLGLVTEKHEVSGPNGKPIETRDVTRLTDEQLEAKIQAKLGKAVARADDPAP